MNSFANAAMTRA